MNYIIFLADVMTHGGFANSLECLGTTSGPVYGRAGGFRAMCARCDTASDFSIKSGKTVICRPPEKHLVRHNGPSDGCLGNVCL